jgi:hypothetical protein
MTDFMPLAHTLLTVVQMELMGILPEPSTACRQGACPIPADTTFPIKASYGTMICRSSLLKALWMAILPHCGAVRLESDPQTCQSASSQMPQSLVHFLTCFKRSSSMLSVASFGWQLVDSCASPCALSPVAEQYNEEHSGTLLTSN